MIKGILNRSKTLDKELEKSGKPLYRNRKEITSEKLNKVGKYNDTWFLRGENTSVLKVQCTPHSLLAKNIQSHTRHFKNPDGGSLKIVEKSGKPIFSGLRSKQDKVNACVFNNPECPVSGSIDCDKNRIVCLSDIGRCFYIHS